MEDQKHETPVDQYVDRPRFYNLYPKKAPHCDCTYSQFTPTSFVALSLSLSLAMDTISLLLFTAVPLLLVVATAAYFVIQNDQKTPLG